jgi:hypothetical protein
MPLLVPGKPAFPYIERLVFNTQTLAGGDRSPQRIARRKVPRQVLEYTYPFKDEAVPAFDNLLHYNARRTWYVPQWGEQVKVGPRLTAGTASIPIDTRNADWRSTAYGNYAVLWQSPTVNEVTEVTAVLPTTLTVSPLTNAYSGPAHIAPCRTGYLLTPPERQRWSSGYTKITMAFEVIDNGTVDGFGFPGSFAASYDGIPLVTAPGGLPGAIYSGRTDPSAVEIANGTGRRLLVEGGDFNSDTQSHLFVNPTRAACYQFRQFLHWAAGGQKSFLVPTFRRDMTLSTSCLASATTLIVNHAHLADYLGDNPLRDYIALRPGLGTPIVRRIEGVVELDASREQLTLDDPIGTAFVAGTAVSWVDACCLPDGIEIEWRRADWNMANVTLTRVPPVRQNYGASLYGMGVYPE